MFLSENCSIYLPIFMLVLTLLMYVCVSSEMCVVLENILDQELEWVISPVTPAYVKVTS